VEADFPQWRKFTNDWIARARRGTGVVGGPEKTRTTYFYESGWKPYGSTWGAPFPPTATCDIFVPSPSPSPSPSFDPNASPGPAANGDGNGNGNGGGKPTTTP